MITATWTIFLLPVITAAVIWAFFISRPQLAGKIATAAAFATCVLSFWVFFEYKNHHHHAMESAITWMQLGGLKIEFGILINELTLLMLLVVTSVATLVFLFSSSYMHGEEGYSRYYASLCMFVFSMLGIVLSNNFIQIFIFWELVGLSSYLLIGFYYQKPEASTAGKKAFLTTRIGDVGMMIGILGLFGFFAAEGVPSFNFHVMEQNMASIPISAGWLTFICIGLFLGAVGKSAQVPLHVWLPDAMEGPTPVSALIHAATMVAAGIFFVVRVFFVFEHSPGGLAFIAWTGGITAIIAASIAFVQTDIKKVLAYSTLSQLGYMVMALGLKAPEAGMFHLTTHAAFKALLFLGAGSLIHAMHTQNIWEMANKISEESNQKQSGKFYLFKIMPVTAGTFLIGTLALMGLPPLSGFFSKEAVLYAAKHGPKLLFLISMAVVFMTSFYMGRVFTIVFVPTKRSGNSDHHIHEGDWRITLPLLILGVVSVIAGYFPISDFVMGGHGHGAHHGFDTLAMSSLILALSGFGLAFFLYRNRTNGIRESIKALRAPGQALENKWYFDKAYDWMIQNIQENIARAFDVFERYVIVEWSANGLARLVRRMGDALRKMQTGVVQFYAFVFTVGVTLIIFYITVADKV